jgi:hypothetical protein
MKMTTINIIGRVAVVPAENPIYAGESEANHGCCDVREESVRDVQHCESKIRKTGSASSLTQQVERCSSNALLPFLPRQPLRLNLLTQTNAQTG